MALPRIGVLALQGAVDLHIHALERLGVESVEVRRTEDLARVDGLVLPGGESSTISKLLVINELFEPLAERLNEGMPAFGTCAGMIMLASEILDGRDDQLSFGAIDISVRRNAFGRQIDSFETDLSVIGLPESPVHAVFIRAPVVERVGPGVEILAAVEEGRPVACRQGNVLVTSFHPELSPDLRLHELFIKGMAG
ncbi:MAG: pyridoxal 5'-phosphate synthase glutaminase subunit PdxT [Actinobacteria bacterium]|uniref:glutaminase n=1 Tax=freshwater metagenome TaxID=449393 RepID=A0A6J6XB38_9ZZZZ|nr:pyridoxal 5'-phosphate synthase glutaminase subunit PdxT [Actinomycetota bacterium]MSW32470.1 pyridoxal 5'-phosphate synthase glutaminase subunit PdxT [Actinomycetota bacterium]MSX35017.1 pyridoxal 5'-phosphate synthase glutaminase subunit PdxT [Actinomycetota bacterium]MSY25189.1 pyridoxal 5'-phosphate synthase glutaminase subunit PdxT [Actinomycetota bacterium]MSY34263.1 pyridoxal 5'-phosphate synthase glutaminase subunit PdxT [Actinomycetota bacterium]